MRAYLSELRPHQWAKNALIFVPAIVGHQLDWVSFQLCFIAFIGFSLVASAGYIINDILDLAHDRAHPTKRLRPIAAGKISTRNGWGIAALLLSAGFAIGTQLPTLFLATLLLYFILSLLYSLRLKRVMMLDVIVLSLLYGLRMIAGGVALLIPLSPWLLSFASFMFLSLALIKRCSELVAKREAGGSDPAGRGYRVSDLPMLESMATAAGYVAALTMGLYISSDKVTELYAAPDRLWAMPILLLLWISRVLLLTHRGQMNEDPVIFALTDRASLACGLAVVLVLLVSM